MKQYCNIRGEVTIVRYKNSIPYQTIIVPNMIVQGGLKFFAERIANHTNNYISSINVGNNSTPPNLFQTGLVDDVFSISSQVRFIGTTDEGGLIAETYIPTGITSNIVEIGLFDNEDTMLARTVLEPNNRFNKIAEESISLSWHIILGGTGE